MIDFFLVTSSSQVRAFKDWNPQWAEDYKNGGVSVVQVRYDDTIWVYTGQEGQTHYWEPLEVE